MLLGFQPLQLFSNSPSACSQSQGVYHKHQPCYGEAPKHKHEVSLIHFCPYFTAAATSNRRDCMVRS